MSNPQLNCRKNKNFSFKKEDRLLKRSDFIKLSKTGRKAKNKHFVAIYTNSPNEKTRLGITVNKKIGCAAKRNRIKRVIREFFRLNIHSMLNRCDINMIVKTEASVLSAQQMNTSLNHIFKKVEKGFVD